MCSRVDLANECAIAFDHIINIIILTSATVFANGV